MDVTCATCKWWTDITTQYDDLDEWDRNFHPRMREGNFLDTEPMPGRWGVCTKADELGPRSFESQFYVTDGSDYMAHLHTRETFGCNQHEPADNAEPA